VLKGVHIGANSIVGANAVVTRDVAASSCAVGVPARARTLSFTA
jgi:acetyltransferase-like isoleucine patch superfamily enzyme